MGKQPKYPIGEYVGISMPSDDMDINITGFKSKLVKTRKESKCMYCGTKIDKGDYALAESGFIDEGLCGRQPYRIHYCIDCVDDEIRNWHGEENAGDEDWRKKAYQRWLSRATASGWVK